MKIDFKATPITNPMQKFFTLGISTGFGLGYVPVAPGTAGSLLGIPLGLALLYVPGWQALLICAAIFAIVQPFVKRSCEHWGEMDASKVVIDEVLGQAIGMLTLRHFVRMGEFPPAGLIIMSFIFFRILDIVKPFPAKTFDRQPTAFGVLADDVVSGLYTALVTYGLIKLWPNL
ncbi:phosphatidylglycerophosphatase A [bacterium]|nr:phosphatidylglycerophosphatase A [bacterium]